MCVGFSLLSGWGVISNNSFYTAPTTVSENTLELLHNPGEIIKSNLKCMLLYRFNGHPQFFLTDPRLAYLITTLQKEVSRASLSIVDIQISILFYLWSVIVY